MNQFGKILIIFGALLVLLGLLLTGADKFPFLHKIGRLPGDIIIRREIFYILFSVDDCLLASLLFYILFNIFRR
jgi:hypothetical protein